MTVVYQVITPLVIAKQEDGSDLYLYQGAPVPENLRDGEVKRLTKGGFIEKVKEEAAASTSETKSYPDGDPAETWKVAELEAYASEKGVDISAAKNNAERVATIAAAAQA